MVTPIVNNQESVVGFVEYLHRNRWILGIMLGNVQC